MIDGSEGGRRLEGKVAFVTGASSGIGAASARRFAELGASVALVARRPGPLEEVAEELGSGTLVLPADVADPAAVTGAIEHTTERLGPIEIVVNSAGVCVPTTLAETDEATWRRHIDVNLSGSFYVAREAGTRMAEAGAGTIINVGSELSVMGMGMYVAYCAAKAGVIGLTRSLAAELAPKVTVNAICPGPVDTPMLRDEFTYFGEGDEVAEQAKLRVPLRRFATAEEVAAGICYLALDAPYATGTTLEIDGGTTAV